MKYKMIFYFKNGTEIVSDTVREEEIGIGFINDLKKLFDKNYNINIMCFGGVIANNEELQAIKLIEVKENETNN